MQNGLMRDFHRGFAQVVSTSIMVTIKVVEVAAAYFDADAMAG